MPTPAISFDLQWCYAQVIDWSLIDSRWKEPVEIGTGNPNSQRKLVTGFFLFSLITSFTLHGGVSNFLLVDNYSVLTSKPCPYYRRNKTTNVLIVHLFSVRLHTGKAEAISSRKLKPSKGQHPLICIWLEGHASQSPLHWKAECRMMFAHPECWRTPLKGCCNGNKIIEYVPLSRLPS